MYIPSGRLQTQPVLESCCQMVSMQLKAPTEQCQNCKHQLSLYGVFLWSFQEPSNGMCLWNPLYYHTETLSMKYQNLLPSHTYLPLAIDFLISDPCEVSLENEDIASRGQCQGLISELGWVEQNVVPDDGGTSLMNPQPNTRWWYRTQELSYKLQKTALRKQKRYKWSERVIKS